MRTIVDDASIYDHLKLLSLFVREAGYRGLLVSLDEMVNLYKIVSSQARQSNYEQLLRILNDVLQGTARNLGFIMGGTPEFLMDTRRGLYTGIPQIKPTFLDIAPAGIPPNIIPHSKSVKCGLMRPDSLKFHAFIGQPLYCQA